MFYRVSKKKKKRVKEAHSLFKWSNNFSLNCQSQRLYSGSIIGFFFYSSLSKASKPTWPSTTTKFTSVYLWYLKFTTIDSKVRDDILSSDWLINLMLVSRSIVPKSVNGCSVKLRRPSMPELQVINMLSPGEGYSSQRTTELRRSSSFTPFSSFFSNNYRC